MDYPAASNTAQLHERQTESSLPLKSLVCTCYAHKDVPVITQPYHFDPQIRFYSHVLESQHEITPSAVEHEEQRGATTESKPKLIQSQSFFESAGGQSCTHFCFWALGRQTVTQSPLQLAGHLDLTP